MVSIVDVNITGLLIQREMETADGVQSSNGFYQPVPVVAGASSRERVEDTVRQALHHYFLQQGILADLTVSVVPVELIEQGLFPGADSTPIDKDYDGYYYDESVPF